MQDICEEIYHKNIQAHAKRVTVRWLPPSGSRKGTKILNFE